jgi:hypothetical protein
MSVTLDQVVPWGRSLEEYRLMFDLSERNLGSRILGCGDGPASFNCEMTALGHTVVSCDPIYIFSKQQIEQRVRDAYDAITSQVKRHLENYLWDYFPDADQLGAHRLATMRRFLADFDAGKADGRYHTAALPHLPFADRQFDLAVCSHLLFLYSEQLSLAFHQAAIQELCRIADEVRIFPLLALDCQTSPYVEPIQAYFTEAGFAVAIVTVPYQFQRGGDKMMRIARLAGTTQ